jgi:hypothetical protein
MGTLKYDLIPVLLTPTHKFIKSMSGQKHSLNDWGKRKIMKIKILISLVASFLATGAFAETYDAIKTAIVEKVSPSGNSMYEYELNYKFVVKGFWGYKVVGKAMVIGRNRSGLGEAVYYSLRNDGLDKAIKNIYITGPAGKNESIEIVFAVNEWEKQGRDRGSEGIHLLIRRSPENLPILYYKGLNNEWAQTAGTVSITSDEVAVRFSAEGPQRTPEKYILHISRNTTLDLSLGLDLPSGEKLLGLFSGGRR